ncbi:MAG TPA: DUF488 domain-containing protein [Terrimicrobiaceae bacterium]|nr:DUF488 domain-containing protein [Terrimicrobiaceae bacterium]
MAEIFTLGYEGTNALQFMRVLQARSIDTLVDVREMPLSRKPGFSKNALAEACENASITYEHWHALGCPKDIRASYKMDGDWDKYTRRFRKHLPSIADVLEELTARALTERICLVCFEADPHMCHRSYVSQAVSELGPIQVVHLTTTGLTAVPR